MKKKIKTKSKILSRDIKKRIAYKKTSTRKRLLSSITIPVVAVNPILPKRRRKRSKNGASKMYFDQSTEDAIILFNNTEDIQIREHIFNTKILYSFQKLVENILNTFKFSYFETGPQDVQKECLTHLVANIHKFDPSRKSKTDPNKKTKAYSYFSIIAKHYLILLNNTNYKKFNQNVEISEDRDENTVQLQQCDKYYVNQEMADFINLIIEFWEKNIDKIFVKQRDINIANAVVELFRNSQNISMFNKKALYLYIREMANCRTQQITKIIKKMKVYHEKMKYSYQNSGRVETDI